MAVVCVRQIDSLKRNSGFHQGSDKGYIAGQPTYIMEIIRQRQKKTITDHYLAFEWLHTSGAGYRFDCDAHGKRLDVGMNPAADASYAMCTASPDKLRFEGVVTSHTPVMQPAVGKCSCGREVVPDGNDNDCAGGRVYNLFGQQITCPRRDESGREILAGDGGYEYDRESGEWDRAIGQSR